jgi:DNA-binding NtrC family response regulator
VHLEPLRQHPEDILPLARHFIERFYREMRREACSLHPNAEECLTRYAWPGNVRELRNVLERALILSAGSVLDVEHLPPEFGATAERREPSAEAAVALTLPASGVRLEDIERDLVRQALDATGGNQVRAARLLGISRDALRTRMKKFGFLPTA